MAHVVEKNGQIFQDGLIFLDSLDFCKHAPTRLTRLDPLRTRVYFNLLVPVP